MIDTNELVARLEKVEKQNRRMKVVGGAVLLILAASLLVGWVSPDMENLDIRRLTISDANGNERMTLQVDEFDRPNIQLIDKSEKVRVFLVVDEAGPRMVLYDEHEKERVKAECDRATGSALSLIGYGEKSAYLRMANDDADYAFRVDYDTVREIILRK